MIKKKKERITKFEDECEKMADVNENCCKVIVSAVRDQNGLGFIWEPLYLLGTSGRALIFIGNSCRI